MLRSIYSKRRGFPGSFNPIAAFYNDPMQAWIYANSQASETRDALGPDGWDTYNELRKYSSTSLQRVECCCLLRLFIPQHWATKSSMIRSERPR